MYVSILIVCRGHGTLWQLCACAMAETWPLLLFFRPGNKASSCACQTTCMNIKDRPKKSIKDTDPYRAEMEEQVAVPLDHSLILDYRVLCDDRSTLVLYGPVFY